MGRTQDQASGFTLPDQVRIACSFWAYQALTKMLGVVYFVTAVGKGSQVDRTVIAIRSVLEMNHTASKAIVVGVTLLELFLASLFVSGYRVRLASTLSILVGVLFLIWHLVSWISSAQPDCGCGAPLILKELIGSAEAGLSLAIFVTVVSAVLRVFWFSGVRNRTSGAAKERK